VVPPAVAAAVVVGLAVGLYLVTRGPAKAPAGLASAAEVEKPVLTAASPAIDPGAGRPVRPDPQPKATGIMVAQNMDGPANGAGEDQRPGEGPGSVTPPVRATEGGTPPAGGEDAKAKDANPDESAGKDEPEPDPEDLVIGDARVQRNVPLEKLLQAPELYSSQLVSLERVYCVGDTAARRPDGSVHLALIESDLEVMNDGSYKLKFADRAGLEVDRRLAEQLVRLGKLERFAAAVPKSPGWDNQPAIVTLRVFDRPPSSAGPVGQIVQFEFFQKIEHEVKGKVKQVLFVRYETRTITPDSDNTGRGNAEEWSKLPKLGHAYQQLQRRFNAARNQVGMVKRARSNAMMNSIISQGLNNAIQSDAAAAAERRRKVFNPTGQ